MLMRAAEPGSVLFSCDDLVMSLIMPYGHASLWSSDKNIEKLCCGNLV